MKVLKLVRKVFRKNIPQYISRSNYLKYYETLSIDDSIILLESQQGKNLNGNIFYILKELSFNKQYNGFKVCISVKKDFVEKFQMLIKEYNLIGRLIIMNTDEYYKTLSTAKYLITDTSFPFSFMKKEGQRILNVWHGTPLKKLGKKDNSGLHSLGNVQKNFLISDYLLYPNHYMREHMIEDYMLENICFAKCVMCGYPRNEVFFENKNDKIINQLNIRGKQIIGYMPTWRRTKGKFVDLDENEIVFNYLLEIDNKLSEKQVLLVNLHPFMKDKIDYNQFKHIKPFPDNFETYDVLNVCEILITDYSSVFFDFANTKRKIILFTYDLEEYLEDRGLYLDYESLPFCYAYDVDKLIKELNTSSYPNYDEFIKTYCNYDGKGRTSELLNLFIFGNNGNLELIDIEKNNKENVLIYTGNLSKNGITTALMNLLNSIDTNKYNYYLTFYARKVAKHKDILSKIPENVNYIPMQGKTNASIADKINVYYIKETNKEIALDTERLDKLYKYEIKRCFSDIKFSHVIQYSGYEIKVQQLFGRFDADKIIFVHNNMVEEINVRKAQNPNALKYAYNNYDKVVLVTEDMREPTLTFCNDERKIYIANNIIDYKTILEKSKNDVSFDEDTVSTMEYEDLCNILDSDFRKFISIGRFSPEKGHFRLMDAFNKLWKEDSSIYLILVGGHGVLHKKTIEYKDTLESKDNIIIIRSLSNPYPLLKKCDYFVLSSFHEGFGLVMVEADILGLPVISTNILGPRNFLLENKGKLVDNDTNGLFEGMKELLNDKISVMNVDYEEYNKRAVSDFESLLK